MKKSFSVRTIIFAGSLLLQLSTLCSHSCGAAGDVDLSFDPGSGVNNIVKVGAAQPDGNVIIGGDFTTVNGTNRNRITRLNANGSLDSSFNPGMGLNGDVRSIKLQSDGKVIIGGGFTTVNGTNRTGLARLYADGSLDNNFVPDLPVGALVSQYDSVSTATIAVQPDGKVLVGGAALHYYGCDDEGCSTFITINFLTRLNANGSRDTTFTTFNPAAYQNVLAIALQPDGKVLVGEYFGVVRLNTNGSLDGSFNSGTGPNYWVASVGLQPDGKVVIGGGFTAVNGTNRNGIARLNDNGSLDSSFNPDAGVTGDDEAAVYSVALQSDGKVLIGGWFTAVNGTNRTNIARLNANGSLDSSFNPGTGADGVVRSVGLHSDGTVLIGGDFTTVNGASRPHVARLYGDSITPSLNIVRSNAFVLVSWPVTGSNFQLQENPDLSLPNSWSPVGRLNVTNAGQIAVTVPTTIGRKFFRLKLQ